MAVLVPGRDPKPAAQRRRRNKVPESPRLEARRVVGRPALPKWEGQLASTRAWWRLVWDSPMAGVYMPSDVPVLVRLARLVDSGVASAGVLGEIRQLEDRFGLSPLARRRLAWEVQQASGAPADAVEGEDDDRWLRVVSG